MANLDRESMTKNVKKRFGALSEYEQKAVKAIMEALDCSIEEALDTVESGDYGFYPEIFSLADLAHELVQEGFFGDPKTMGVLVNYIDYEKLSEDLRRYDNFIETSLGLVRIQ